MCGLIFLLAAPPCLASAQPGSPVEVLVFSLDLAGRPLSTQFLSGIQSGLYAYYRGVALEVDSVPPLRPDDPVFEERRQRMYESRYKGRDFKAIVAVGQASTEVARKYRGVALPHVPIVAVGLSPDYARSVASDRTIVPLLYQFDFAGTIRLVLQLFPDTRTLVAVAGSSASDGDLGRALANVVSTQFPKIELRTLRGLTWEQVRDEVSRLPENSTIASVSMTRDERGRTIPARSPAAFLAPAANRPIFGISTVGFGDGFVGGSMLVPELIGKEAASILIRILDGAAVESLTAYTSQATRVLVDWRELRRWGVPESRVPNHAEVQFRPPSIWKDHRNTVLATIALVLLQSAMIAALLFEHRRRRRAEAEARDRLNQIAHMNRVGAMGEMAASLAHEIHQPLSAVLANACAASRILERDPHDFASLREALAEIAEDGNRAGEIIRKTRAMLRRDEPERKQFDLNQAVIETAGLIRSEATLKGAEISLELSPAPLCVQADPIQIQQVLLNLAANALDAMLGTGARPRVITLKTAARNGANLAVATVQDTGPGFLPGQEARAFEPFFTTKPAGLGIGLPLSRSIVESHKGKLLVDSLPGWGAAFHVELPMCDTPSASKRHSEASGTAA